MQKTHNLFTALDLTLTPTSHAFIRFWRQLTGTVVDFTRALKGLGSAFTSNRPLWAALYGALVLLHGIMYALAGTTWLWVPGLKILIDYLIVYYTVTKGAAFITFLMSDALLESRLMTMALAYYTFFLAGIEKAATLIRWLGTAALWAYTWAEIAASAAGDLLAGAITAVTVAMLANPIGLLIAAVILLTVGLVILYFKWKAFHDLVNRTARFLYQHPYFLGLIPGLGLTIVLLVEVIKHFRTLVGWAQRLARWFGRIHFPHLHFPHLPGWVPGFQHGGVMPYSGPAIVGEGGPEIAHFPKGTSITPLNKIGGGLQNLIEVVVIPAPVNIDGQKVAQIVAKHTTTVNARA
jgi:hypothetical protein